MPRKNDTKIPASQIEWLVKRYRQGEAVSWLRLEAHISRPQFYNWIRADDKRQLEARRRAAMSGQLQDVERKHIILAQVGAVQLELNRLRDMTLAT